LALIEGVRLKKLKFAKFDSNITNAVNEAWLEICGGECC